MKQPEITIQIAGQNADMPVPAQAEACLERAWRRHESKDITWAKVSAYQLRWAIWIMVLLGVSGNATSANLTAVVPPGRSGIIGSTATVSAELRAATTGLSTTPNEQYGAPAVSQKNWLCSATVDDGMRIGSTGVWGFELKGPTKGAVLLTDGFGSWSKTVVGNTVATVGHVTFSAGTWSQTVIPTDGIAPSRGSKSDGSLGMDFYRSVACPATFTSYQRIWDVNAERSSSLTVRFLVDAPPGGLQPGIYSSKTIYAVDTFPKSVNSLLADQVIITVASYGCSLTAPASVAMNNAEQSVSTIQVAVTCADLGTSTPSTQPISAWLSLAASGTSAGASTDPQQLGVANSNGTAYIRGNWSSTVPSCTASDIFFDGRDGILLGQVNPGESTNFGVTPVSFRLCTSPDAEPGNYTAQATFSVVQR